MADPVFDPNQPSQEYEPVFDPNKPSHEVKQHGVVSSAAEGALAGASANWSDELRGLRAAAGVDTTVGGPADLQGRLFGETANLGIGAARLAYEHLTGTPGPATEAYNKTVDEIRQRQKEMKQQQPTAYGGGELAGSVASMVAAPETRAATWAGRALKSGAVGGLYGGIAGAGEGENLEDRAVNAAIGTGAGAVGAGVLTPVMEGAGRVASAVTAPVRSTIKGWLNPEAEAAKRGAVSLVADRPHVVAHPDTGLTEAEFNAAQALGEPVMLADMGAARTRGLLRSASNTSPEAQNIIDSAVQDRYRT